MPPQPELPELPTAAPAARRTIASYAGYAEAESAVEWLVQRGFPVQRGAIVGTGLQSVEQLSGAMSAGRAALLGVGPGILVGALFALLAGVVPWDSGSAEVLLYAVGVGALLGSLSGALLHQALSGGRRDFLSTSRIEAERYDLQVDEDSAQEARRLLDAMPRTVVRRA
jgi:Heat induced stress protein YflT domain